MPVFRADINYVPVRADFISSYMVKANGAYVKVFLYALMLATKGESREQAQIAAELNLLESDVKNAFDYWKDENLIVYDGEEILFLSPDKEEATHSVQKKTTAQITREMTEDKDLSELCLLAQEILAKILSTKDMETLYWMYDELGFTVDVITMLLEYCASKDKRSVQYAEKVAITWNERGINTIEAIETFTKKEEERNSFFYSLRKLFGISDRPLSKKEEEFFKKWNDDLHMGEDMVALAYEYCIMQTSKLSFPYMDTILENWNKKNIHDIESAEKEHESYKGTNTDKNFDVYENDVNHNQLEELMHEKFD